MVHPDGERLAPVTDLAAFRAAAGRGERSPSVVPEHPSTGEPQSTGEHPRVSAPTAPDLDALREAVAAIESSDEPVERVRRAEAAFERISNVSMHALARRGMSSREMLDYLQSREFEYDDAANEVARLERVRLLDDRALAETLVRTLRDRKGLGRQALVAELRRRQLENEAIEAALVALEGDDEFERAMVLAQKRAPQLRVHDFDTAKRRLVGFLMRKGYSGGTAASVADRALRGQELPASGSGPVFR